MKNIVLIRGLTREACHWHDFPSLLEKSSPDVRVHFIDLPGSGVYFKEKFPLTTSSLIDFLHQKLNSIKKEFDGDYHVMTISLGGMVVMKWVEKYSHDFESAIIINSSAKDLSPIKDRLQLQIWKDIIRTPFISDLVKRERNILSFTSNLRSDWELDEIASFYAQESKKRPMSLENSLRQLLWAAGAKSPKTLPIKAIFIASKGDKLAHFSCSERLADKLNKEVILHENAGHDLPLDAPEWLIEKVRGSFS